MKVWKKSLALVVMPLLFATVSNAAIMSAETRLKSLEDFRELLASEVEPLEESFVSSHPSPFVPDLGESVAVEEEAELMLSDEELLLALSEYVNPTGIFMFGGDFYLIFKEKKLKIGSEFGITFNGAEYSVLVTDITGSTYTIRRNDAELQLKLK